MEMLVLVQSLKTQVCFLISLKRQKKMYQVQPCMLLMQDSESLKKGEADISLEIVPRNHPLIKMTELREEGGSTLESLLTLIASHTISRFALDGVL